MESEPEDKSLRGNEAVEPCTPDDCIPLAPAGNNDCPEGTEPQSGAECVDANGECVWEFWEACVPIEGGGDPPPPPPPEWVPPSEGPPRHIQAPG
ncbi:hypothetical protein ACNOYE_02835 [Nannocystaceae bacterium ST9]